MWDKCQYSHHFRSLNSDSDSAFTKTTQPRFPAPLKSRTLSQRDEKHPIKLCVVCVCVSTAVICLLSLHTFLAWKPWTVGLGPKIQLWSSPFTEKKTCRPDDWLQWNHHSQFKLIIWTLLCLKAAQLTPPAMTVKPQGLHRVELTVREVYDWLQQAAAEVPSSSWSHLQHLPLLPATSCRILPLSNSAPNYDPCRGQP